MTIFKRRALFMLAFLLPACGEQLVEFAEPPDLGAASGFAVLAGTQVTNTGNTSVTGDVGVSPGTTVTGQASLTLDGTYFIGPATLAFEAQADLIKAYNDAAGLTEGAVTVAGNIGGQTLTPGLYKSTSDLEISSGDLTLDAQGDSNAIFTFQIASALNTTDDGRQVILTGGARAANVFWQVGSSATIGTGAVFKGTIMALTSIALKTGATLDGRALARNGEVTMQANTIVAP